MRLLLKHLLVICASITSLPVLAQTATSPITSALQASLQAEVGTVSLQDATLGGTAETIAGADDETGSFTFRGTAGGCSRVDIGLTSGTLSETRQPGISSPLGAWMGEDGVAHSSVQHNLMSGYWWPFPALIVNQLLTDSSMVVTFIGSEGSLFHFSGYQQRSGASPGINSTLQQLTHFDLWLNGTTLLPAQLSFDIHPDTNAGVDIPVQVQYLNYQTIAGVTVATHIQKLINNTVAVDAQIQTVNINTGLTPGVFSLQ